MRRTLGFLAALTALSALESAIADNRVEIQSTTFTVGQSGLTVGVYFSNDVALDGIVCPLEIRTVSGQAFLAGPLEIVVPEQSRVESWETDGSYVVKRIFAGKTIVAEVRAGHCSADTNQSVWRVSSASTDSISPDAVFYVAVAREFPTEPGSDSVPGSGVPSIALCFSAGDNAGSFEIDTTCIYPGNHLIFLGIDGTGILPSFSKGTINLVEPIDTLSGHITSNTNLRGTVYLSGDLTIDSGVTVHVRRGTSFIAIENQDIESSGVDTARTEIIVAGTLALDSYPGDRPTFQSSSGTAGSWYGIRIVPGGRFETGIGAVIEDAVIGVRLEKTDVADTLTWLTIRNCDSVGISNGSFKVALRKCTVVGVPSGTGIYVDSGGPLIEDCFIDSCETGILTSISWSTIRRTRINGPGQNGIRIENNPITMIESKDRGRRIPVSMAAEGQPAIVSLQFDTISGYFAQGQFWMGRNSNRSTIDSCAFVHPEGSQRSPYGLYIGWNDTVTVRRSTITGFSTSGVYSIKGKVNLGISPSSLGNNEISADTTGCGSCLLRRVTHTGTDSLKAEGNWWGASPPTASWFSGKVDYNPYLTEPLGKAVAPLSDAGLATSVPRHHSISQNYPNPFNSATEIEFALASAEAVKIEVYNILGQVIKTLVDREFSEGTHRVAWDGTTQAGQTAASGVYLYRIVAGDFVESKKMVLLK